MSIIKMVSARCDICGHLSSSYEAPSPEVKQTLRLLGWRFRNGVHRCPTCVGLPTVSPDTGEVEI